MNVGAYSGGRDDLLVCGSSVAWDEGETSHYSGEFDRTHDFTVSVRVLFSYIGSAKRTEEALTVTSAGFS